MLFEIAARDVELSETQSASIREMANHLTDIYERIVSCRIAVAVPHRRTHQPVEYQVRIDVGVPGGELIVSKHSSDELLTAAQAAFEAARRQLQDHARIKRGDVKSRGRSPTAHVVKLLPFERYGFLETRDGREIYFHANSVVNGAFDRLEVGMRVRYVETMGNDGPQASTVTLTGGQARRGPPDLGGLE